MVERLLSSPSAQGYDQFRRAYLKLLGERFVTQRTAFDDLARCAMQADVYLGCNCPTRKQPQLAHCHTVLALGFMKEAYPELSIVFPVEVLPAPTGP